MPNYLPHAEPFHFPGNRVGCLLIHGFTGTPYEMRELGETLASQGYTVLGPALAGHATCLEDMEPTRWPDWYASVETALAQLQTRCDYVFPIGLSMGGLLALHLTVHHPVAGVVAVSPPYAIASPLIPIFKTFPFLYGFLASIRKNPKNDDTHDPSVRARHPSYAANPTRCVASLVLGLIPHLQSELGNISAPVLLIQSRQDRVIPRDSIEQFNSHLVGTREKSMLWLENSGHLVLEDYAKEQAFDRILEFVRKHVPSLPASGASVDHATQLPTR